jgi:hypothetical protein
MGAMDTWNMWSDLAVNKYLHNAVSCWISSIYIYVKLDTDWVSLQDTILGKT